jgi:hypothetical protein
MAKIRAPDDGAQRQIQTREGGKKIYYGKPETLFLPGKMLHNAPYAAKIEMVGGRKTTRYRSTSTGAVARLGRESCRSS